MGFFLYFISSKKFGYNIITTRSELRTPKNIKNARLFENTSLEKKYKGTLPNIVVSEVTVILFILSRNLNIPLSNFESPIYIALFMLIPDNKTKATISPNTRDVFVNTLKESGRTQETGIIEISIRDFGIFSVKIVKRINIPTTHKIKTRARML